MGEEDPRDLRIAPADERATSEIRTERREEAATDTNSPVLTVDGAVIGTPYYMPPEQALGQIELIDTRSDVYTVGAILYHLITGRIPYSKPGARMSPYTVLAMVAQAPPQPVHELAPDVPAELEAICNKAMARESRHRYADMSELQSDIQAYFDRRVVRAYETGAFAELRKWIQRNRALAVAIGASVLLAIVGLGATATVKARGEAREQLVSDVLLLEELRDVPLALTCEPSNAGEFRHWQTIASELSNREAQHRESLAELEHLIESATNSGEQMRFANKRARQEEFLTSFASYFEGGGFEILNRRADYSREVEERTVSGTEARAAWTEANRAIGASPNYGFQVEPVLGVLPLDEDPTTGLWDFWLVESGDRPERDASGEWIVTETMGIVLVLLPGGEFLAGAQNEDSSAPNFDPNFDPDFDTPLHLATVAPRMVSRFEMTQGQWLHSVGENPALNHDQPKRPLVHPIEGPTWYEYKRVLDGLRLRLPTIDEWEHAARAGTSSIYFAGDEVASLEGHANVPDQTAIASGKPYDKQTSVPWSDGHSGHAPVGSFRPNAFGLFDVHGNVAEWCGEPLSRPDEGIRYPLRGGAFDLPPVRARIASGLTSYSPTTSFHDLGIRPVMDVALLQ